MVRESEVREGEITVDTPPARDAALFYIGRIRTPWKSRLETPRQGRQKVPRHVQERRRVFHRIDG